MPVYTLDEIIKLMEPQARKDKALAVRCIDGLTEYAAELRQKAGPDGRERTGPLRTLVSTLAGYWGLDDEPGSLGVKGHTEAFDRRMAEADMADGPWSPSPEQKGDTVYGLYRYAMDLIPNLGADAREDIRECGKLIREIEQFWDFGSPVLDELCDDIDSALREQMEREAAIEMGGMK